MGQWLATENITHFYNKNRSGGSVLLLDPWISPYIRPWVTGEGGGHDNKNDTESAQSGAQFTFPVDDLARKACSAKHSK